ncbi:hypothetical protein JL720_12083 [Aureococcus anophagefferens]|nr:hypothetical protein JL720_12083 [Aureococcus anophagefferens]
MPSKKEVKKAPPKKEAAKPDPLFQATPRNFRVGGDIQPTRDLSRFVKWPRYVRLQRQKKILQQRLKALAEAKAAGGAAPEGKAPTVVKFGLKHVTYLVENKKAKLVCIASDVDPIELVVWLPALCKKMDVPYCIVKNKSRLGTVVHQKTAAVCCLTTVKKEDQHSLDQLRSNFKAMYNDNVAHARKWGGGIMGLKTQAKLAKREKALQAELAKKAQY